MSDAGIEVTGLAKAYGEVVALDGVSFTVAAGTVCGLLGPNGSGKTTTVSILSTALRPDAGSARVCGLDVVSEPAAVRSVVGFAGQFAAVDANLSGRENLALIGRLSRLARRSARERASELLEAFALTDAADRLARTYSGGMRRRLDVAAALVQRPPVLFMDEPTTGLAPQRRFALWEVLRQLVAGGTTVLLTTQYLEEADELADQVVIIDAGRVVEVGTPGALKARVGAVVLSLGFTDETAAAAAAGVLTDAGYRPERDAAMVRVRAASSAALVGLLAALRTGAAPEPTSVGVREPSLDDVFLALTGKTPVAQAGSVERNRGVA
ncbi:MAG: ATP-binding cassette domain-containing protein [Acidimicrobiales bacterium]